MELIHGFADYSEVTFDRTLLLDIKDVGFKLDTFYKTNNLFSSRLDILQQDWDYVVWS